MPQRGMDHQLPFSYWLDCIAHLLEGQGSQTAEVLPLRTTDVTRGIKNATFRLSNLTPGTSKQLNEHGVGRGQ